MIRNIGVSGSSILRDAFVPLGKFVSDGSSSYSLIFSGIPQTYKDLMLVATVRSTTGALLGSPYIRLNDDSSGLYQFIYMETPNSTLATALAQRGGSNATLANIGRHPGNNSAANQWGTQIIHINNYSSTSHFKTVLTEWSSSVGSATQGGVGYCTFIYRSTNGITSIRYADEGGGNFVAGSTFRLYGIRTSI